MIEVDDEPRADTPTRAALRDIAGAWVFCALVAGMALAVQSFL